jgi:hypothetical protein
VHDGRGGLELDPGRHVDRDIRGHDRKLGVGAAPSRVGDHRPSEPASVDPLADRLHAPRDAVATDVRWLVVEVAAGETAADQRLDPEHVHLLDGDRDLARSCDGVCDVLDLDHVRIAEHRDDRCSHLHHATTSTALEVKEAR